MSGQVVYAREGCACPYCGGLMEPAAALIGSVLSRRQMQIFFLLRNRSMTVGELAEALFRDDQRGGPDWADGIVTTAIARMRKKVRQYKLPLRIRTLPRGGYSIEVANVD